MFEHQDEIKFFKEDTPMMDRPPNYETNPACGTPNPPPWCDPNSTNIDMGLSFLIFVALILLIFMNYERKSI